MTLKNMLHQSGEGDNLTNNSLIKSDSQIQRNNKGWMVESILYKLPSHQLYLNTILILVHNVYISTQRILCMEQTTKANIRLVDSFDESDSFLIGNPDQDYSVMVEVIN